MSEFLPFSLPEISEEEIASVVDVLRSGWLTTGPKTKLFEKEFAAKVGSPHAILVNSCTAALHLALEAIGVKAGDEVIVPTMTFAASAEVVRYLDAVPVLVDIRASDHNIDLSAIERAIGPRTRAIIPVHFAGKPVRWTRLCHWRKLIGCVWLTMLHTVSLVAIDTEHLI
jgi:perosamine synthetase